jgi:hypothetical protein
MRRAAGKSLAMSSFHDGRVRNRSENDEVQDRIDATRVAPHPSRASRAPLAAWRCAREGGMTCLVSLSPRPTPGAILLALGTAWSSACSSNTAPNSPAPDASSATRAPDDGAAGIDTAVGADSGGGFGSASGGADSSGSSSDGGGSEGAGSAGGDGGDSGMAAPGDDAGSDAAGHQVVVPGGTSYEAEAKGNTLFGTARRAGCTACMSSAAEVPEGPCCSGGGEVENIVGHPPGAVGSFQFNGIAAPTDGIYDIDWWYFCGQADANGDMACPWVGKMGLGNTPPGCRPAQFLINGTPLQTADVQFPCFPTLWSIVHLKTIAMPLKAGSNNTIQVLHVGTDAPNFDRIVVHDGTGVSSGPPDAGRGDGP